MATNRVREKATRLSLPVPAGTVSGDPLVLGALPCVATTDRGQDTAGEASVQTDGSWEFPLVGEDDGGNQAIVLGDIVYLQPDGSLSLDAVAGKRFGYALAPVGAGDTTDTEIKVGY